MLVYTGAFLLRLVLWQTAQFGDEAHHYYVTRTFGAPVANVDNPDRLDWLFWWRPLFSLLLLPGALLGFSAFRLLFILIASLLPLFALLILRDLRVRAWIAYAAAGIVALHPYFLLWGYRVFPDALMSVAFAGALWCHVRGRPLLAGLLALASVWIKEVAIYGVVFLFLAVTWQTLRNREFAVWPLRLTKSQTAFALAGILGPLPSTYAAFVLKGHAPGWSQGGDPLALVDRLFLLAWLLPLVLLGMAWKRTRFFALLALVFPAFYAGYRLAFDGGINVWYYLLPSFLALIAAAFALDEWWSRARAPRNRLRPGPARSATVFLALVLTIHIFFPLSFPAKGRITMPFTGLADAPIDQVIYDELHRGHDLPDVVDRLSDAHWKNVLLIDPEWFVVYYPFADEAAKHAGVVGRLFTGFDKDTAFYAVAVEQRATVTIIAKHPFPGNLALRTVYLDCLFHENPTYFVVDGMRCSGRADALKIEWERREAEQAP